MPEGLVWLGSAEREWMVERAGWPSRNHSESYAYSERRFLKRSLTCDEI